MTLDSQIPMMGREAKGLDSFIQGTEAPQRNRLLDLQIQNQQAQANNATAQSQINQVKAQFMPVLQTATRIKAMGGATPENLPQVASLISQSGADPDTIQRTVALLQSGDLQGFNSELDNVLSAGAQLGLVKAPQDQSFTLSEGQTRFDRTGQQIATVAPAPSAQYTNIRPDKSGALYGTNKQTGQFELIPTPEGVEFGGSGTSINLDVKGQGTEVEALAKSRVKRFEGLLESADNAIDQDEQLSQLSQINTETGFGVQARGTLAAAINGIFGEDVGDNFFNVDSSAIQAYNALSNKMVNSELNKAKGPQTEGDAKRARDTIANITNEQQANAFIIASLRATNARKIEQAAFYQNILETEGTLKNADKEWASFKRKTPMLSTTIKHAGSNLPMFYNEFKQQAQAANPTISDQLVIDMWRDLNKGMSMAEVQAKYAGVN